MRNSFNARNRKTPTLTSDSKFTEFWRIPLAQIYKGKQFELLKDCLASYNDILHSHRPQHYKN